MKRLQFRITAVARDDIDSIGDFIRQDNPARAASFVDELAQRIEAVAERPLSFPSRPDVGRGIRSALHGSYIILFRATDREVIILRVSQGARDLPRLIEEGK